MDDSAVKCIKVHYDNHVDDETRFEKLKKRNEGPALPLKNFHNKIKACLIKKFCYGSEKILDMCCGRGGDIAKWNNSKIKYVKGIDLSSQLIKEANLRFFEYKKRIKTCQLEAEFKEIDILGKSIYEDDNSPYDNITCFFALHYFLESEESITNLFRNMSHNLKEGGYVICTCPDGKRVVSAIVKSEKKILDTEMLKLIPKWKGPYECFGSGYIYIIKDTITEGHSLSDGSYEYLVFTNVLTQIAAKFGLKLLKDYEDQEIDALLEDGDKIVPFKHFKPSFSESHPSLKLASSLNMVFIFQKVKPYENGGKKYSLRDLENLEVKIITKTETSENNHTYSHKRVRDEASYSSKLKQPKIE